MQIDHAFSELVGLIYEGTLEEEPWHSFLVRCQTVFNASVTNLILRSPTTLGLGSMHVVGGIPENIATYNARAYALDPFVNLPEGKVVTLHEFVDLEAWFASDF